MNAEDYQHVLLDLKRRRLPLEVKCAVMAMLDKKAEHITVLKLKEISGMTDYLLIAQGNSTRQNKAIADHVVETLRKEHKRKPYGSEGESQAEWILLDYVDFVVNIFAPEQRARYALEKLWMDAKRYEFDPLSPA